MEYGDFLGTEENMLRSKKGKLYQINYLIYANCVVKLIYKYLFNSLIGEWKLVKRIESQGNGGLNFVIYNI